MLFETDFILTIWLKTVPDNTVIFLRIMICTSLIYAIANPLIVANQATGKVKRYQAVCGSILLMILPISYILLLLGCPAYSVFIAHFVMEAIAQLARMIMLRPLIGIGLKDYIVNIYSRIALVVVSALIPPFIAYNVMGSGIMRFFVLGIICVMSVPVCAYYLGLNSNERVFVMSKVQGVLNKIRKK